MKLLTSSSSSYSSSPSSSSSTLSFDPSLCHSESASAGCLTAILRRILCSGALPTHPSDQIRKLDSMSKMSEKVQELKTKQNTVPTTTTVSTSSTTTITTPGLVARLMGLDSMVETTSEAISSSSLSRSKSMNSADYLGECRRMEGLHRRVKSSSFRELPTFHLLENENFLVLSFESENESKEFKSNGRRNEKGSSELKQKKKNKREKVHDEKGNLSDMSCADDGNTLPLFKISSENEYIDSEAERFSHHMEHKEVIKGENVKKRRKNGKTCYAEKKVETECSSEDSSPVSVFDFERKASGTEVDSFGVGMSWRRKLSPELENDQIYVLHCVSNLTEERKVKAIGNNKHEVSKKKEKKSQECVDIWGEICRLVEDEMGSNLLEDELKKQGDFRSISEDFESEIFDRLLNELIDQLVGNPLEALQLQSL